VNADEPPAAFDTVDLVVEKIPAGRLYGRIYGDRFSNPLDFGKGRSRFSDPRRRVAANRFGVLYLGSTLEVCFIEALLRDKRNGAVSDYPMDYSEFVANRYAIIEVRMPLSLVGLRESGPIRMGVPSDVVGASTQGLARRWSLAMYQHPAKADGIIYPSRLNEHINLAVYDRAVAKLKCRSETALRDAKGLAAVIRRLKVAIDPATLP
jgi:hypothetical protein